MNDLEADIYPVKEWLGHTDPKTTERYAQMRPIPIARIFNPAASHDILDSAVGNVIVEPDMSEHRAVAGVYLQIELHDALENIASLFRAEGFNSGYQVGPIVEPANEPIDAGAFRQ